LNAATEPVAELVPMVRLVYTGDDIGGNRFNSHKPRLYLCFTRAANSRFKSHLHKGKKIGYDSFAVAGSGKNAIQGWGNG
jgi:hypothetical protein